ncbi:M23 family metallopeptidase [Porticoccus sp.]|uniref:M23 family metallopeptidase n=1 Tax=Porticoccus sp. TaxID=2024853 RepID=UPI003F69F686
MLLRCLSLYRRPLVLLICLLPMGSFSLELKGELVQGGMLIGRVTPGEQVEVMGRSVRVDDQGLFVFGLGRDAPAEIKLTHTNGANEVTTFSYAVEQRVYREQRVEGVPQKTVTPPPEVLERIRREATLVREARTVDDRRTDFLSGFVKPLEGPITGVYGSRRVYNGTPGNPHYGLDIAAPTGTEVFAPAPGVVTLVHREMFYSGGTLLIDHGYGISSTFIHLSELLVEEGQQVAPGDPIARVGATGRATGPHLDWRINWFDVRLDPALVLDQFPAAK